MNQHSTSDKIRRTRRGRKTGENLRRAEKAGEIREGGCEVWSWALIGMTVFLGMLFADWDERRTAEEVASPASELVAKGMAKN